MITVAIILVAVAVWVAAATYTVFLWCERDGGLSTYAADGLVAMEGLALLVWPFALPALLLPAVAKRIGGRRARDVEMAAEIRRLERELFPEEGYFRKLDDFQATELQIEWLKTALKANERGRNQ